MERIREEVQRGVAKQRQRKQGRAAGAPRVHSKQALSAKRGPSRARDAAKLRALADREHMAIVSGDAKESARRRVAAKKRGDEKRERRRARLSAKERARKPGLIARTLPPRARAPAHQRRAKVQRIVAMRSHLAQQRAHRDAHRERVAAAAAGGGSEERESRRRSPRRSPGKARRSPRRSPRTQQPQPQPQLQPQPQRRASPTKGRGQQRNGASSRRGAAKMPSTPDLVAAALGDLSVEPTVASPFVALYTSAHREMLTPTPRQTPGGGQ